MISGHMAARSAALRPFSRTLVFLVLASGLGACKPSAESEIRVRLESGPRVAVDSAGEALTPVPGQRPLRFAYASVLSPERSTLTYAHFASYLSARLGRRVEILRRRTYAELNELLRNGTAQAGIVCTGAYAVGHEQFGLRAITLPEVGGQITYRSYLVTRHDSEIDSFDDLRGGVFAFTDPLSNTGYRFVAAELLRRGTTPDEFFSRFFFTYSHDNAIEAVRDGIADAGSVDSLVWDYLVRTSPDIVRDLRIVAKSEDFPINPVVAAPTAPHEVIEALVSVLLGMADDVEAAPLLQELGVTRFVKVTPSATAGYAAIERSWHELGVIDMSAHGGQS